MRRDDKERLQRDGDSECRVTEFEAARKLVGMGNLEILS